MLIHPNSDNQPEGGITQIQTIILKVQRLNKLRKFELQNGLTIWCLVGTNDQDVK